MATSVLNRGLNIFFVFLLTLVLILSSFPVLAGGGGGGGGGGGDATEGNVSDATGGVEGSTGPGTGTGPAAGTEGPGDVGVQGPEPGFFDAAVSAVVDIAVPAVVNVAVAAVTGQSVGHAVTGVSTTASDVVEGIADEAAGVAQGVFGGNNASNDVADPAEPTPGVDTSVGTDVSSGNAEGGEGVRGGLFGGSAPLAPSIRLSANKPSVLEGESVELSWSVSNASSCSALDSWSGAKSLSGEQTISNLDENSIFTLSCKGADGSWRARSVFVTVLESEQNTPIPFETESGSGETVGGSGTGANTTSRTLPAPTLTLSAQPETVFYGEPVRLVWSSENTLVCVGADDWPRSQALNTSQKNYLSSSGSKIVFFITTEKQFTLACYSPDGRLVQKSVNVEVTPVPATLTP